MSVISSLILQRLAPAITAFVLFLNSVAGLFGAAPVIPYNPERTDVVVSGEVTTDVNEILGYYNAAVKKTNKSFVIGSSSSKVNGTPEIVMDEETVSEITNELMKTYWTTLEATSSTVFKVPGEGNVIAADVESAKMSVKDGKRYVIINIVDTKDSGDENALDRVYGYSAGLAESLNSSGYMTVDEKNVNAVYTDNTVSCIIDDDSGKIIYGDWDSTGSVEISDITVEIADVKTEITKMSFSLTTNIDV